jgi:hypothetical protein
VAEKIRIDELRLENPEQTGEIQQLNNIVCDILKMPSNNGRQIRIARQYTPLPAVKQAFLSLNKDHVSYVLDCLMKNDNGKNIKNNAKAYYLTCLFNSVRTIDFYSKPQKPAQTGEKSKGFDIDDFMQREIAERKARVQKIKTGEIN